ncbi:MAG: hypothetical protein ACK5M7_07615 [Draconibacterium sp.]
MNRILRLLGTAVLLSVYSYGIGLGTGTYAEKDTSFAGTAHGEGYWSAVSNSVSFYFSEPEKQISDVRNNTPVTSQSLFTSFLGFAQVSGWLLENKFVQYIRVSETFLLRYRKADLIFPFHYFW